MEETLPLHVCHVNKSSLIFNRLYMLLQSVALISLFYYRIHFLFQNFKKGSEIPTLPCLCVIYAELSLSFIWFLSQAFRWRPVFRSVFAERLPPDEELPAVDVFICTADPDKEPTLEVMNTVISAMSMDYPPDKLFVYLSDDGGSSVTSHAMHEVLWFAKWWIPFCRNYGIKTRCPEAYFTRDDGDEDISTSPDISWANDFTANKNKIKEKYNEFKKRLEIIKGQESQANNRDHSTVIQVLTDDDKDDVRQDFTRKSCMLPTLIYVSREKRTSYPHHFKAGALNVLLRVSGLISNSRYILVLDCDMYCNDPTSARQAMCFHLDQKPSNSSLAFVQFPQKFHNLSENDIYDSEIRTCFKTLWHGMDGLEGPCLSGTGFYMNRVALYGKPKKEDFDIKYLKHSFGSSNAFIKTLVPSHISDHSELSRAMLLEETETVASCAYEDETQWGKEVGFMYFSVVEDFFTDFKHLHGRGWTSVYCNPSRPAFLGACTTNFNDKLVQGSRWMSGLIQVGLSKFSPITYGPTRMSLLQSMCYSWLALHPIFYSLAFWCLATVPQLCLLSGIPLYPQVSNSFFIVFPFIFILSNIKHLQEIISGGGSNLLIKTWINELREWMIDGVSSHTFGSLGAIKEKMGFGKVSFLPTNKFADEERTKLYQMGIFDFQISTTLLTPMVSLVILNIISFTGGIIRAILLGNLSEMLIQICLSLCIVVVNYPFIEGMVIRKDKGSIPNHVTTYSFIFCIAFLLFGSLVLMYL